MPCAPVCWVTVTRSMGPAIRMLSRGLYLLLRLPVLIRECGDPEYSCSRAPSPSFIRLIKTERDLIKLIIPIHSFIRLIKTERDLIKLIIPIELLPRRGTSGVTGKNPSSSSPRPFPNDDKFGSKSFIINYEIRDKNDEKVRLTRNFSKDSFWCEPLLSWVIFFWNILGTIERAMIMIIKTFKRS